MKTEDYERGSSGVIQPAPWQTDTCIGDRHYKRSLFLNHGYKTVGQVVGMLVNIVSKNGNLLLSVPLRGDGTIDEDEVAFLHGMADWMKVNGEGIFGSRPWKIYGEGPAGGGGGMFNEGRSRFTAQDIRFTTRNGARQVMAGKPHGGARVQPVSRPETLYAYFLGWPDNGSLVIRSLASGAAGSPALLDKGIVTVSLLGSSDKIAWTQGTDGLSVKLPATKPCKDVFALKLTLKP